MKKHLLILAIASLIMNVLSAQNNVKFETFIRPYHPVTDSFSLNMGEVWDDPDVLVPLALRSEFFDSDTNFYIYSFGLGAEIFVINERDEIKGLFAMDYDLIDRGAVSGISESELSIDVEGQPGSRVLVLEWKNAGFFEEVDFTGESESHISFQIRVYESEPAVEYHYGPSFLKHPLDFYSQWENIPLLTGVISNLDIENELISMWVLEGNSDEPTIRFIEFINPDETDISGLNDYPEEGRVYKFYLPTSSVQPIWNKISDIKITPGITRDILRVENLSLTDSNHTKFTISNNSGQTLISGTFNEKSIIDVSGLSSGLYQITVSEPSKWPKTLRFVKI